MREYWSSKIEAKKFHPIQKSASLHKCSDHSRISLRVWERETAYSHLEGAHSRHCDYISWKTFEWNLQKKGGKWWRIPVMHPFDILMSTLSLTFVGFCRIVRMCFVCWLREVEGSEARRMMTGPRITYLRTDVEKPTPWPVSTTTRGAVCTLTSWRKNQRRLKQISSSMW